MIGALVTFRYGANFDERAVRKIAEDARARFEGLPALRSKAFTINSTKRELARATAGGAKSLCARAGERRWFPVSSATWPEQRRRVWQQRKAELVALWLYCRGAPT